MKRRITLTQGLSHSPDESAVPHDGEWSIPTALALLVRRRKFIISAVLAVGIVTAGITLLIANTYISTASILPSGAQDKMADLKSLAGLGGMMGNDENSSELFPTILASQTIRDAVLGRRFEYHDDGKLVSTTLSSYLEQDNPDKLRRALASITRTSTDKKTGVISVAVETTYPELSREIVKAYIDELEAFNLIKRKSKGKESAEYLATQVETKRLDVELAEDSLEEYQTFNRDWATSTSPEVTKIVTRLQRELQVKTLAYTYLQQQYEMARLDAQKDVPIVRVLDPATLPTEKSAPMRTLIVLSASLAALLVSILWVFASESWRRVTRVGDSDGFQVLSNELDSAFPRIRRKAEHSPESADTLG